MGRQLQLLGEDDEIPTHHDVVPPLEETRDLDSTADALIKVSEGSKDHNVAVYKRGDRYAVAFFRVVDPNLEPKGKNLTHYAIYRVTREQLSDLVRCAGKILKEK
jgi:hypothetical protein